MTNRPWPVLLMARELNLGGSERQMTEVARNLDRSVFEPHVGCFRAQGIRADELIEAGIPVLRLPVQSFRSWSAVEGARQMRAYLRQHDIRLVHTFDVPLNLFGTTVARASRVPVVLSSQRAHRNLTPGVSTTLLRMTDRFVNGVVVNCEAMRTHLLQDENVPPEKVHVCYNAIDTVRFSPPSGETRAPAPRPELQDDALNIGVVCALRSEKGLPTLLEAFSRVLRESSQPVRLTIVGSGPMEEPLKRQAVELGIRHACHFEPGTSKVADWLRWLDIFVLPSLSEALSNALMEAMACGCCPVASEVGGNPELVRPGVTGLLFPPSDAPALAAALRSLIEETSLRRGFAAAACRYIHEHFSREASMRCMEGIYRRHLVE